VQQLVAQITWGHNIKIISKLSNAIPKDIKSELPTIEEIELATTKAILNESKSHK